VQIILVTAESRDRVGRFLKETRFGQSLALPVAAADTLLASWFPHRFLSHTVWLQGGTVKGITSSEYITDNTIEILLAGRSPGLPVKKDDTDFNTAEPLLKTNPGLPDFIPRYTTLTGHIQGLPPAFRQKADSPTASVKTTVLNKSILETYLYAYGLPTTFPASAVSLNVRDEADYRYTEAAGYKLEWDLDHTFCYESVLPLALSPEERQARLLADLDFYFGLVSRVEVKKVHALALVKIESGEAKPMLSNGAAPQYISLSNLVYYLNHHWYGTPVFNETGITEKRYIPFDAQAFARPATLQTVLTAYGLALKPVEKDLETLTLSEVRSPGRHNALPPPSH
jgi:hypothetical protein